MQLTLAGEHSSLSPGLEQFAHDLQAKPGSRSECGEWGERRGRELGRGETGCACLSPFGGLEPRPSRGYGQL